MTTEDEESRSSGGAYDKQQKDEGEVKEKDAQQPEESNKPESSVRRPKASSACKIMSHMYSDVSIV